MDLSRIENPKIVAAIQAAEAQLGANATCQLFQVALREVFSAANIPLTLDGELGPRVETALSDFHSLLLQTFAGKVAARAERLDAERRVSTLAVENVQLKERMAQLERELAIKA